METKQINDLLSAFAMCLFDTEHTWEEIEELIRDFTLPEDMIEHCLTLIQLYKYTEQVIRECSGIAGIRNFRTMKREQFKEWFFNNIQFNEEQSKKKGLELLELL